MQTGPSLTARGPSAAGAGNCAIATRDRAVQPGPSLTARPAWPEENAAQHEAAKEAPLQVWPLEGVEEGSEAASIGADSGVPPNNQTLPSPHRAGAGPDRPAL